MAGYDADLYRQQAGEAVDFLRQRLAAAPELFIQSGTGLGGLASAVEEAVVLDYRDIPHFPRSTVSGHEGRLFSGRLGGRRVIVLQGRFHYYEGYSTREVSFPVRVLALLGARCAIITNAAGGLSPSFQPGHIMIFKDHLSFLGDNPLRGPNIEEWGPRFPDLSVPYDPALRRLALDRAQALGLDGVSEGIYACVPGPSLETPAETRWLRMTGADAVGMSSVPEVLVARHAGLRVLGLSVVANVNDPDNFQPILLEEIIAGARQAGPRVQELILSMLRELTL